MAKVYAAVPGAVLRLGSYGEATDETPAMVPDVVAKKEFGNKQIFRVDLDEPDKDEPRAAKKKGRRKARKEA